MSKVSAEILRTTTPSGQSITRVLFCREAGICVTVDMEDSMDADENALMERARSILVETATFSLAQNEYDAESNGNPDVVTMTSARSGTQELYIFEYRDGDGVREVPPGSLPSFEAARAEALRGAVDLLLDLKSDGRDETGWLVRVRNGQGEILHIIDAEEAESAHRAAQEGAQL